jgi:hypothetical protein
MEQLLQDVRYALTIHDDAAQQRVYGRGPADACARDRRDYGCVFGRLRRAGQAAPVSRRRSPRAPLRGTSGRGVAAAATYAQRGCDPRRCCPHAVRRGRIPPRRCDANEVPSISPCWALPLHGAGCSRSSVGADALWSASSKHSGPSVQNTSERQVRALSSESPNTLHREFQVPQRSTPPERFGYTEGSVRAIRSLLAEVAERQTRQPQELVGATQWRFKSSLPHQPSIRGLARELPAPVVYSGSSAVLHRLCGSSKRRARPPDDWTASPNQRENLFAGDLRNLQDLSRFDLIRIRQLIAICLEDFHVRVGIAKLLSGDLAQCVAGFDRVAGGSRGRR